MRLVLLILTLVFPVAAQRADAVLADRFGLLPCEELHGRLSAFAAEIRDSPGWKGVVVGYEGKYGASQPVPGEVHMRIRVIRSRLELWKFDMSRIIFISGGFRENHEFELYRVPPGGGLPTAKPSIETMRYRHGRPTPIYPTCP